MKNDDETGLITGRLAEMLAATKWMIDSDLAEVQRRRLDELEQLLENTFDTEVLFNALLPEDIKRRYLNDAADFALMVENVRYSIRTTREELI